MTIVYLLVIFFFNPVLKKKINDSYKHSNKINSFMIESISAVDTVKNNSLEEKIKDDVDILYSKFLNKTYETNEIYNFQQFIKDLIYCIGALIILFFGSVFVLQNKLSLVKLITYNSLIVYFLEPIKNIFSIDIIIKRVKNSISMATELFEVEEEKLTLDDKYSSKKIMGDIVVKSLSYSYNNKNKLFKDVDINIKQGDKILIYGKSGAGKSTFAKILIGYLKVKRGSITIDNKDINDYNIYNLRNDICYVSQNEYLFSDSVYNNITINKNVDYDSFLKVCKTTMVDQITNNHLLSYNMLLEENGFNISGGERQRIILARALLKEANIYVFDESLSQIDIERERKILKNIFKQMKDKTIIIISHRFNNQDLFDTKIDITRGKQYD